MNPEDFTITEYLDQKGNHNRKYIYLFPEKKELTYQEREDMALSLLAVLPRYLGKATTMKSTTKFPVFCHKHKDKF